MDKSLERKLALKARLAHSTENPDAPPPIDLLREPAFDIAIGVKRERAKRELARRHLLPFIMRFNPKYEAGWVHKDICQRLEKFSRDVEDKKSPRLMLFMPPRHGKSEIASRMFPAWHLGHHPEHEVIACSYSASLALKFSRKVRSVIRDQSYTALFPKVRLDNDNQAAENWMLQNGGGYMAAGVSGPLTGNGMHCFPAGVIIGTEAGPMKIEDICASEHPPKVWSYNEKTEQVELRPLLAVQERYDQALIHIQTESGRTIRSTPEHPFYIPGRGYVEAKSLSEGDSLYVYEGGQLPHVRRRETEEEAGALLQGVYPKNQGQLDLHPMFGMQSTYGSESLRNPKGVEAKEGPLFFRMLRQVSTKFAGYPKQATGKTYTKMQNLREGREEPTSKILFTRVPERGGSAQLISGEGSLSNLWAGLSTPLEKVSLLWQAVRGYSPFNKDDRRGEQSLQRRAKLLPMVQNDAPGNHRTGSGQMRNLRNPPPEVSHKSGPDAFDACNTPYRPRSNEQSCGESGYDVRKVPPVTPPLYRDPISSVSRSSAEPFKVYDLQVQGNSNFFANEILVHNCGIIDDPVKNREEAESENIREGIKDWYTSTFYTRLAPGAGILIILTRWHDDDLAGWLLEQEKLGGDKWEVVKYPAIAEQDERFRKTGEPLHPARYDLEALGRIRNAIGPRDWEALYQQNPVASDGDYFKNDYIRYYMPNQIPPMTELKMYTAWDLAIGTKDHNDYSVGLTIGVDVHENLYLLDVVRVRQDAHSLVDLILDTYVKWQPEKVGIEKGHIEMTLGPFLRKRIRERKEYGFNYEELKTGRRDKIARARSIQGRMQQGMFYVPTQAPWVQVFVNELLRFPNGKHDDQVDALAWIGLMMDTFATYVSKKPKAKKSWKDRLKMSDPFRKSMLSS